jgi:hypothetical protein
MATTGRGARHLEAPAFTHGESSQVSLYARKPFCNGSLSRAPSPRFRKVLGEAALVSSLQWI